MLRLPGRLSLASTSCADFLGSTFDSTLRASPGFQPRAKSSEASQLSCQIHR
jgi:hypothetical protein